MRDRGNPCAGAPAGARSPPRFATYNPPSSSPRRAARSGSLPRERRAQPDIHPHRTAPPRARIAYGGRDEDDGDQAERRHREAGGGGHGAVISGGAEAPTAAAPGGVRRPAGLPQGQRVHPRVLPRRLAPPRRVPQRLRLAQRDPQRLDVRAFDLSFIPRFPMSSWMAIDGSTRASRRHLGGFLLFLALAVAGATREAADEVVPGIMRYDRCGRISPVFLHSFSLSLPP
jgi:hypothetical protein